MPARALRTQQARAHHRRQRQRDKGRDQDGYCQRDGELVEQPTDHIAHEQQRNQHRDQRHRQRNDREADLLAALERRLHRRNAVFHVTRDVLDHHDRVVDHEAGGYHQRHQRQVVDREARQVDHAKRAHQRHRHRDARNHRGTRAAQEQKDHHHDECHGQQQLAFGVVHRCADRRRSVGDHLHIHRCRERRLQSRQQSLDAVHGLDHVGARLPLHIEDHAGCAVGPGGQPQVFGVVDDLRHVLQAQRVAIFPGDDEVLVLSRRLELVVGVDRRGALRAVEAALGLVDIGGDNGGAHVVERQAERGQRLRIGLNAHRRAPAAGDTDETDAIHLRELWRQPVLGQIVQPDHRQ